MKTIITFSVLCLLAIRNCGGGDFVSPMIAASVVYTGAYEVDGCGYQIQAENDKKIYKPANLSEQFRKDGLKIWVEFREDTSRFECGDLPQGLATVRILKIEERQ